MIGKSEKNSKNSNSETTEKEKKRLFKLADLIKHLDKNGENISDKDMEQLAYEYGNLDYYFMHDCVYALECEGFGLCSLCMVFERTMKVVDGPLLHCNQELLGFSVDGGYSFRHFIAHDGRMYHIKEENILWDRLNCIKDEDIKTLKELTQQQKEYMKQLEIKHKEEIKRRKHDMKAKNELTAYG